jgi:biotin carboxyl carrier protein
MSTADLASRRRAAFNDFPQLPRQRLRALAGPHPQRGPARWGSHIAAVAPAEPRVPSCIAAACPLTVYAAHVGWFAVASGGEVLPRPVTKGDVLGAINCLGLDFKVIAPRDGTLVEICAPHDKAVEYGQPLLKFAAGAG